MDEVSFGFRFRLLAVPIFGEMTNSSHELGGGRAKKLSKGVGVYFLTSASTRFFVAKNVSDGRNAGVESSLSEDCGFDWRGDGGRVNTDSGIVDSGTGSMTEDDRLFVEVVRELSFKKRDGACM